MSRGELRDTHQLPRGRGCANSWTPTNSQGAAGGRSETAALACSAELPQGAPGHPPTPAGSQRQELRRTIGGFLVISEERLTPGAASTNRKHQYLFHDHLGSVDVIVEAESLGNVNQGVVDRKSYNAHGERRQALNGTAFWHDLIDPRTQATTNDARTDRGFTGHEHIDRAGIVHMNGRLYDPLTGRMLSADPIVQEPYNLQNLNRYSYVLNNPLSYTDPTGLSFVRKYWRQIVQIAAAVLTFGQSLWVTMATSFTVGVAVTGSLRGGLIAAFSAAVFHGIGGHFAEVAAANRATLGTGYAGVLGTGLEPPRVYRRLVGLSHATAADS